MRRHFSCCHSRQADTARPIKSAQSACDLAHYQSTQMRPVRAPARSLAHFSQIYGHPPPEFRVITSVSAWKISIVSNFERNKSESRKNMESANSEKNNLKFLIGDYTMVIGNSNITLII